MENVSVSIIISNHLQEFAKDAFGKLMALDAEGMFFDYNDTSIQYYVLYKLLTLK